MITKIRVTVAGETENLDSVINEKFQKLSERYPDVDVDVDESDFVNAGSVEVWFTDSQGIEDYYNGKFCLDIPEYNEVVRVLENYKQQ